MVSYPVVGAPLEVLWTDRSFRAAVEDLFSLDPDQLSRLTRVTQDTFNVPGEAAAEFGLDPTRFELVVAALGTLYQMTTEQDSNTQTIIAELADLSAGDDSSATRAAVTSQELRPV